MSKCEACGGDGQIEYGAYRGDESGPTRECKLCGGVITTAPTVVDVVSSIGVSAQSASAGLNQLAHMVSKSGRRVADLVVTIEKSPKELAAERLEQLRLENERRQLEAESTAHVDEYYRKAKRGIIP